MSNDADAAVDPRYRDASLPVDERVEILLGQMTVEEKVGQFFHTMISAGDDGELSEGNPEFGIASNREYVVDRHLSHFNVLGAVPSAQMLARWHNKLQELAAGTRLGIPVTISTDPRHSYTENPGTAIFTSAFSQWPESLGLAATRDVALVRRFAEICRQEYAAVGIRVALHPQIDLATEPRWARQLQTFGEDADLSGELGAAYIRGLQGETFGPGVGVRDDEALPGRRPAEGRRGPALPVRRRAGVHRRRVRVSPEAVHPGVRGGDPPDHAVLRQADGHRIRRGRLRPQPGRHHGTAARAFRLRGHRLHRLGPDHRSGDARHRAPGARLGRRAPHPARAHGQDPGTPAATSSAASSATTSCSTW